MTLYRIAARTAVPRRYEALAARVRPADRMQFLSWCGLVRISDGAGAEALLLCDECEGATVDLSTIPAERVLRRPTT